MDENHEETTFGMTGEQISRLLAFALEPTSPSDEDSPELSRTAREALGDLLSQPLPSRLLPSGLRAGGQSVQELLQNPRTPLRVLKAVKEHGKALSRRADHRTESIAATIVYYAAIACARLFHAQMISDQPVERLADVFGTQAKRRWVPAELREVFAKAKVLVQSANR
ncbi:MAG: hypothetical protein ISS72_05925 [Candidatus Brocadiae bacterium]|nr:hypothetical protein [Candidatus Brocadiia bacterium]